MSIGGATGAIISALLADNFPVSYSFFGTAFVGFSMAVMVANTNSEIEEIGNEEKDDENRSFCADIKKNLSEIREALQVPEFHKVLIFLVLKGLLVPRFSSFSYFFATDVLKTPQSTIAIMNIVAYICLLMGS